MRRIPFMLVGVGVLLFVCLSVWAASLLQGKSSNVNIKGIGGQSTLPMTQVTIGSTTLGVELATTNSELQNGLSGRAGLPEGRGMLFVFDPPASPGFWMKDMNFPLDILFIDEAGSVVTIYKNLSPDTYPQTFHPDVLARYALEVPAGFADAANIAIGTKVVVQ